MGVLLIVVVLTGLGVTFLHIYWTECHVSTHILDRILYPNICILDQVLCSDTFAVGCGFHERTAVILHSCLVVVDIGNCMFLLK